MSSRVWQWRLWRRSSLRRLVHSHFSSAHTPSHPPRSRPVRTRAKLISSATAIIRRPSHVAVFLFLGAGEGGGLRHIEGVGVPTGGRGVLCAHPRSGTHPTHRLARIIPAPPRARRPSRPSRRRRYYIRGAAAGRKLIAKILRI